MKILAIAGKARNGKTTVANMFKDIVEKNGKKAIVVSYAGYVKYICTTYYGWNGEKDEAGRTLLQTVGDGFRLKYGERYWIDKLMNDIEILNEMYDYVLIDDCRYPNEILIPQSMFETYSVGVKRIDFESDLTDEQKNHRSEVALDNFKFDYVITSISGIENLIEPTKSLYNTLKNGDI